MAGSRVSAMAALVMSCAVLALWSPPASAQDCTDQRDCLQKALDLRKRLQASEAAKGNRAGVRQLQTEIDQIQRDIKGLESTSPVVTSKTPAQPAQPVGPPPNKSTVSGIVPPDKNAPTPAPAKPPPVAQPTETPLEKTVREVLEQQNPQPKPQPPSQPQSQPQPQPTSGQPTGSPPPGQKAGGVRLNVQSQGQAEDLDRNDVLKLLRKPGM